VNDNFRARIYPAGTSDGIGVEVQIDGNGKLTASNQQHTVTWPADDLNLRLGGCADDRLVLSCPGGDTIISTDMRMLDALAASGRAISAQVDKTRKQKSAADFRKHFNFVGIGMVWYVGPLLFIGVCIVAFVMAVVQDPDFKKAFDEAQQQQTTTEQTEAQEIERKMAAYEELAAQHMKKQWHLPKKHKKSQQMVASFQILDDGSISDYKVESHAKEKAFETLVKTTVDKSTPFPGPPNGTQAVQFSFTTAEGPKALPLLRDPETTE
jgi:hypothetical protein